MAVTTQMRTQVAQLYVSLFGRAPEADGLGYWVAQLGEGKSFQAIAQDMFNVAPARAYYPSYLTNEEIVAKFYVNVLGRTADAGGLAYWTGRLNTESTTGTAASKAIAQGTVITEMLTAVVAYSGTDAAALQSQSLLNNKVAVALHYAVDLGGNDVAFASTLIPLVTAGATGTTAANAAADASFNQTKTLTVSATDVIVGGNANDTIIGQTGQTSTLQASDKVDGANGTDTLRIVTDNNTSTTTTSTGTVQGFTVTNVEVLEVQAQDAAGTFLGLENVDSSLKTIRSASSNKSMTVKNVNNLVDVEITKNLSSANVAIQYTAAAVAGTADTQKVALNGNTTGTLKFGSNTDALSGAGNTGIETIAFTSTGAASTVGAVDSTAKTITVAGDKNLTLGGLNAAVNKVDAGTFTGKLGLTAATAATNVTVIGGTAADTLDMSANTGKSNITAGDGDDVIVMGANLNGDDSIDGGNGSDTIVVGTLSDADNTGAAPTSAKSFANVKSVETLTFSNAGIGSLDATANKINAAGVMTYNFDAGLFADTSLLKTSDAVTVNVNASAGGNSLAVTQAVATGATATGSVNVVVQVDGAGNSLNTLTTDGNAVLNLTGNDAGLATAAAETLTVGDISDVDLTTLNVKGNANVVISGDLNNNESLATITSTTTGNFSVIDTFASDDVPGLTVSAVGKNNTIATGAGNDVISAGGSRNIIVTAGDGNNTVTAVGGADYYTTIGTGSGADNITVTGDGTNEIYTGNGNDVVKVTGAGDSYVQVGTGIFNVSFATGTNTVYADAAQFTSTDSVTGGNGWDTIQLTGGSIVALTDGYFNNVTAVEQLNLNNNSSVTVNQIANAHGLQQINVGNGAVTVGEGFTNALTVEMTGGSVTVTGNAIAGGALTVLADVSDLDGGDTITGGKSTSDKLVLTADNSWGTLTGVTSIESVTLVNDVDGDGELVADSATLDVGAVQAKALTIDASAMIGALTVNAAGQSKVMTITGSAGANDIVGGNASDVIVGGKGADSIEGGLGSDALTGGAGADKFVYRTLAASSTSSYDTISDFQAAKFAADGTTRVVVDKIQVNNDASVMTNGPATVTFKGAAAGFGNAQALLLNNDSTHGAVIDTTTNSLWIDLNNDGTLNGNDLRIDLTGVTTTGTLKFATDNIQVMDLTAPAALTVSLQADTGTAGDFKTSNGQFNIAGLEAGATWEYSTNGGGSWTAGTGTSATLAGDGAKSVLVRQSDGTNFSTATALNFTLDTVTTAATVALTTDTATNGDKITSVAALTITATEAGSTQTYSVNGGAFGAYVPGADGAKSVVVRSTDAAGNTADSAAFLFTLDTGAAAPTVALATDSGTPADNITNAYALNVTGVEAGATVQYSVDAGASWQTTYGPIVGDGGKNVLVRQIDTSGNTSAATTFAYVLDTVTTAPVVALTTDSGSSNIDLYTSAAALTITGTEAGSTQTYSVDGGAFGAYVAPTGQGSHSVIVRSTDIAGNTADSAEFSFTLDTLVSAASIVLTTDTFGAGTAGTNADSLSSSAALTVTGTEVGSTQTYSVNGGAFGAYAPVEGSNTVIIRTTDLAGNTADSAGYIFTLDTATAAGTVTLTTDTGSSAVDKITSASALSVAGTEAGSALTYSVNGGAFGAYVAGADGAKSVVVRSTDAAGNTADSAAFLFTLDTVTTAATLALTTDTGSNNADAVTSSSALTITATEAGATLQYSVNGGAFGAYAPVEGANSVVVRATDVAGNTADSAAFLFTLDTTAPTFGAVLTQVDVGADTNGANDFFQLALTDATALTLLDSTKVQLFADNVLVASSVAIVGGNLEITPVGGVVNGVMYDVAVIAGAVVDLAGNMSAQLTVIGNVTPVPGVDLV